MEQKPFPNSGESRKTGKIAQAAGRAGTLRAVRLARSRGTQQGCARRSRSPSALPHSPSPPQPFPRALPLHSPSKALLGRRGRSSMQLLIYSSYFTQITGKHRGGRRAVPGSAGTAFPADGSAAAQDRSPCAQAVPGWWQHSLSPRRGGISVLSRLLHPLAASSCCLGFFFSPPPPLGFAGILLRRRSWGGDSPAANPGGSGSDGGSSTRSSQQP